MRIYILSAVITIIITNDSCADTQPNGNNLITTYDPGETATDISISPSLRSYGQITADEPPDYHTKQRGLIRFEGQNPVQSIKFEDSLENFQHKETYNNEDDLKSDTNHIVFEDNALTDEYDSDNSKTREEIVKKPIKFENNDEVSHYNKNNYDSDRNTATERVTFNDGSNTNEEPVKKKNRKPRRKSRYQKFQGNPNSLYPGYPPIGYSYSGNSNPYLTPGASGYSTYPGSAYPSNSGYGLYSGNQGLKEPKPPVNPVAYPNPGQDDQSGHTVTRYPTQGYGFPTSGVNPSGNPGTLYPEFAYNQGYPPPGYPQAYPGDSASQNPVQGQYRPGYQGSYQPGYQSGLYRPSRRPKSLPERAVSAVAEALTSIALYDDYQCVPKLLCEVAGGRAVSSPTLLKATAGLQPLLTLLQAYNGVSSSPLFVFGRAAVMGMTANGNTAACRYAYPKCPNDPTELVNYLNNHNGGFFRFFGQPENPQKQQNLEQFYNYLSGQYGFQQQSQQNYGLLNQNSYGLQTQKPYTNTQKYGLYNHGQTSYRKSENNTTEAEYRIQNKPGITALDDEDDFSSDDDQNQNSKWLFPDNESSGNYRRKINEQPDRKIRASKTLKFPGERSEYRPQIGKPNYIKKYKAVYFPGGSHFQMNQNYQTSTPVNFEEYVFDHKHNFYVKRPKAINNENVVYVVRGNGDPNHPEIVKVRPGQSI